MAKTAEHSSAETRRLYYSVGFSFTINAMTSQDERADDIFLFFKEQKKRKD